MRKSFAAMWATLFLASIMSYPAAAKEKDMSPTPALQISGALSGGSADHAKFKVLKKRFTSGPEVTKACLSCHTETGRQFIKNIHWTWTYKDPETGQTLGKRYLVNNFCTNARGNEGMCAECHPSYGYKNDHFDFKDQTKIDCLVCHDSTDTYYRLPPTKGNAACAILSESKGQIDLNNVARHVGLPKRRNCGSCHFYGGGGDNVKHGDLSSVLNDPPKSVDVHMAKDGLNLSCTACHVTKNHVWTGSRYAVHAKDTKGTGKAGLRRYVTTCESCHGTYPHNNLSLRGLKLNSHVDKVACETCHIPTFARGGVATKTDWDWSTAGRTKNGKGYTIEGYAQGNGEKRETYWSIKGTFKYAENVVPYYAWFDGQMHYTTIDTRFDPSKQPIEINHFKGSYSDPKSRIWPFKRMHTKQQYDKVNDTLVYTHLWGADKAAFWGNFNMRKAIEYGMKEFHKPYSGQFGFIETYSYWPITHMVAPKKDALACGECHAREGRLKNVGGFYLPGRDYNKWVDGLGLFAVAAAFLGVMIHGSIRLIFGKRSKNS